MSGTSQTFTVNPLVISSFNLSTPAAPSAGTAFDEAITAVDVYGNTSSAYAGLQVLTFTGPSDGPDGTAPGYPSSVSFIAGVGTVSMTLADAETTTLTAAQGSITGTSVSFTVAAPGAAPQITQTAVLLRSPAALRAVTNLWQLLAETLS